MNEDWKQWKFAGIYKITNSITGKIYIGQAQNLKRRIAEHGWQCKQSSGSFYFHNAIKKYGYENFYAELLEKVDDLKLLNEREQYWMDFYKSYNKKFGYNTCSIAGSCRGNKATDETRKKLSDSLKGRKLSKETIEKMKLGRIGKIPRAAIEAATIARMKIARSDNSFYKRMAEKFTKSVVQMDKDSKEIIKIWKGSKLAAETLNISKGSIQACCRGKCFTAGGFEWKYEIDNDKYINAKTKMIKNRKSREVPIYQINKSTDEIIMEWKSMKEACLFLNIKSGSHISLCCNGKRKSAYGFKWQYINSERMNKNVSRSSV